MEFQTHFAKPERSSTDNVKSEMFISKEVQLQVFQRSFSTKGNGRGIGTYSIKLLSENYLNGKVGFTSSVSEGTVFFVDLFKTKK